MTAEELVVEASKIKGWTRDRGRFRRERTTGFFPFRKRHTECPLTAVANERAGRYRFDLLETGSAAVFLGVRDEDVGPLVSAADESMYNAALSVESIRRARALRDEMFRLLR